MSKSDREFFIVMITYVISTYVGIILGVLLCQTLY